MTLTDAIIFPKMKLCDISAIPKSKNEFFYLTLESYCQFPSTSSSSWKIIRSYSQFILLKQTINNYLHQILSLVNNNNEETPFFNPIRRRYSSSFMASSNSVLPILSESYHRNYLDRLYHLQDDCVADDVSSTETLPQSLDGSSLSRVQSLEQIKETSTTIMVFDQHSPPLFVEVEDLSISSITSSSLVNTETSFSFSLSSHFLHQFVSICIEIHKHNIYYHKHKWKLGKTRKVQSQIIEMKEYLLLIIKLLNIIETRNTKINDIEESLLYNPSMEESLQSPQHQQQQRRSSLSENIKHCVGQLKERLHKRRRGSNLQQMMKVMHALNNNDIDLLYKKITFLMEFFFRPSKEKP